MRVAAFEKEILARVPRVCAFIRKRVQSTADAEDLAQETVLKAFRARRSLRDDRRLEAWLYRVARRTVSDHYRRQCPQTELADTDGMTGDARLDKVTADVAGAALCYLGTLPYEYQAAVRLADYEGLPHKEVARRLGISLCAAKARIRRGKQRIRELMEHCCLMVYDTRGKVIDYDLRSACSRAKCH
jgi:RNA polymerase sigma-70 factor (ECF subfamily)